MQIVRLGDEYPGGFEAGARAFAYDPTTDTVYTHPGHHPDILQELYDVSIGGWDTDPDLNRDEYIARAAEDYLGGGANGPEHPNGNKIGAWSGNIKNNKPIPDPLLVNIGQTIGNSEEIPQIQDAGGGSASGRDPILTKTAGDLTNSFIYYNGKLVVDNKPHPIILRDHFPEITHENHSFHDEDLQAGLIFEENGKIYPVFHSYTVTSQERKREALMALEKYYMRPIEEELDYEDAMRRLTKFGKVHYIPHPVTQEGGYNAKAHALIYDPATQNVGIGPPESSHAELLLAVEELPDYQPKKSYPQEFGYHHGRVNDEPHFHQILGEVPPQELLNEIDKVIKEQNINYKGSAINKFLLGGFRSFFFINGFLYIGAKDYENHAELAEKFNLDVDDFVNNPFVAGVIGPQGEGKFIPEEEEEVYTQGDIQFYSDFLASQGEYDYEGTEQTVGEQLIEKNRTEGGLLDRAVKEIYGGAQDNLPGVSLTIHGEPIEDGLPSGVVGSVKTSVAVEHIHSDWSFGTGSNFAYAYDQVNDILYYTNGHHPDILTELMEQADIDLSSREETRDWMEKFVWGWHHKGDTLRDGYPHSGNMVNVNDPLSDEKIIELQTIMDRLIKQHLEKEAASLPKVMGVSYPYPEDDDEGPDHHGMGLPFTYFPEADTIVIADEQVFHIDMFDWVDQNALEDSVPTRNQYKMLGGDFIPGRVDKNGDVGFYAPPGEHQMRIAEALRIEGPTISSYIYNDEEYGNIGRPGEDAETGMKYDDSGDPSYIVNIASVKKVSTEVQIVDNLANRPGTPDEYPFIYIPEEDRVYLATSTTGHGDLMSEIMGEEGQRQDLFNGPGLVGGEIQGDSVNILYTDDSETNADKIRNFMQDYVSSQERFSKVAATINVIHTPYASHGEGSGYPFFYHIASDTLWVADNESLHMELIEAAGLDMSDEDYLYAWGGDAGGSLGYLSGRVGNEQGYDAIELFEGDLSMMSKDAIKYLQSILHAKKTSSTVPVIWVDMVDNAHGYGLPWIYNNGKLVIGDRQGFHINLAGTISDIENFTDDRYQMISGRIDRYGNVLIFNNTGDAELENDVLQTLQQTGSEIVGIFEDIPLTKEDNIGDIREEDEIVNILDEPVLSKTAEADMSGAMFGLQVPINIAQALEMEDGEPAELMHVTLAYFKDKAADRDDWQGAVEIAKKYDFHLSGELTEYGTFDNDGTVLWIKPEVPGLAEKREDMVAELNEAGYSVDDKFDFNPHITIKYYPAGEEVEIPELEQPIPVSFNGLYFYRGENIQKVAKTAAVHTVETGQVHFGYEDRRPVIYDPNTNSIYLGNGGAWHSNIYEVMGGSWEDDLSHLKHGALNDGSLKGYDIVPRDVQAYIQEMVNNHILSKVANTPQFKRIFEDVAYNPMEYSYWKALVDKGYKGDTAFWGICDRHGSPHHMEALEYLGSDNYDSDSATYDWSGAMWGEIENGKVVNEPRARSHVGGEEYVMELVQRELDQRLMRTSAVIAPNIEEVYQVTNPNYFIFVYDPSEDELFISNGDKFHIDLINYILGVHKHTNPDDSYALVDKYIMGFGDADVNSGDNGYPTFHNTDVDEKTHKRIIELGTQVVLQKKYSKTSNDWNIHVIETDIGYDDGGGFAEGVGEDYRRPVLYNKATRDIGIGSPGTHHASILRALDVDYNDPYGESLDWNAVTKDKVLYDMDDEVDKILNDGVKQNRIVQSSAKMAIIDNHAGSWLYFPETDDFYLNRTHSTILEYMDLSPSEQYPGQIKKALEEGDMSILPPYIMGQISGDGEPQVHTDGTLLDESAMDSIAVEKRAKEIARKVAEDLYSVHFGVSAHYRGFEPYLPADDISAKL